MASVTKPARARRKRLSAEECNALFSQADKLSDAGLHRQAARLFLRLAEAGDDDSQINIGVMYSEGKGVRRDDARALYWYRRALRRGSFCAANNIGILYRDQGWLTLAIRWLERAIAMGDHDAALTLGRIYLNELQQPAQAARCFAIVTKRNAFVTECSREEAVRLLAMIQSKIRGRSRKLTIKR